MASVYAGSNCKELHGHDIMLELIELRRLIDICYLFSKKPFPVFLELAGYVKEDALLQEPKAGVRKCCFEFSIYKHSSFILVELLLFGTLHYEQVLEKCIQKIFCLKLGLGFVG